VTRQRARTLALGALALLLVGFVLAQAFRDVTPPNVWTELEERHETGAPFTLFLSADEPVTYDVTYGEERRTAVAQDVTFEFTAKAGSSPLDVQATDGAGNVTTLTRIIQGVTLAEPTLTVQGGSLPGRAFTVLVSHEAGPIAEPTLRIDGRDAPLLTAPDGLYALGATPLTTEAGFLPLALSWRDALDRDAARTSAVRYGDLPTAVQELNIPASTLSVITPEGRERENAAIEAARTDPFDPPRWSEPFLLPIEGRGTSGFAIPRRYAPGGPVSFHEGEDIAAPTGTPVAATNTGLVRVAGMYPIKGGMVILDHGAGVTSRYYHLSRILVSEGDEIEVGTILGEVGSTGLSTGPHLHWEIRVAGRPTNPLDWVGRVRP